MFSNRKHIIREVMKLYWNPQNVIAKETCSLQSVACKSLPEKLSCRKMCGGKVINRDYCGFETIVKQSSLQSLRLHPSG